MLSVWCDPFVLWSLCYNWTDALLISNHFLNQAGSWNWKTLSAVYLKQSRKWSASSILCLKVRHQSDISNIFFFFYGWMATIISLLWWICWWLGILLPVFIMYTCQWPQLFVYIHSCSEGSIFRQYFGVIFKRAQTSSLVTKIANKTKPTLLCCRSWPGPEKIRD